MKYFLAVYLCSLTTQDCGGGILAVQVQKRATEVKECWFQVWDDNPDNLGYVKLCTTCFAIQANWPGTDTPVWIPNGSWVGGSRYTNVLYVTCFVGWFLLDGIWVYKRYDFSEFGYYTSTGVTGRYLGIILPQHATLWNSFDTDKVASLRLQKAAAEEHVAFYYPGKDERWDTHFQSGFLGNFWEAPISLKPHPESGKSPEPVQFKNAEAAFQALKFWDRAQEFSSLSGKEAFDLKKKWKGQEDWEYAGYGNNWEGMMAVLKAKFASGSPLRARLKATGDKFLLEHNKVSGLDFVWSDNQLGDGTNWLGAQLMMLRDSNFGAEEPHQNSWGSFINPQPSDDEWMAVVRAASDAVNRRFPQAVSKPPSAGGLGAVCVRPGCGNKYTWNGMPGEYCGKSCRDLMKSVP